MNKAQYFFLMLKQGIKGVFKFRAQFTIILILSLLATMILSLSISTGRRIEDSYNQVVGKVDPFDHVSEFAMRTGNTNFNAIEVRPMSYIATNDYIAFYDDGNDLKNANTKFNYILSQPDTYRFRQEELTKNNKNQILTTNHRNFVTEAYKDPEFKKVFVEEPEKAPKPPTKPSDDPSYTFDPKSPQNLRWYELRKILLNYLLSDLDNLSMSRPIVNQSLKYTPLGDYTIKHPNWYKEFLVLDPVTKQYDFVDWIKDFDLMKRRPYFYNRNFQYFDFIVHTTDSIILFFELTKEFLEPVVKEVYSFKELNNAQLYALIFGEKAFSNDQNIPDEWLIKSENNLTNQYSIWFDKTKSKKDYIFLNKPEDSLKNEAFGDLTFVAKHGFKGNTGFTVDANPGDENDWNSVRSYDFSNNLSLNFNTNFLGQTSVFSNPYFYRSDDFNIVKANEILSSNILMTTFVEMQNLASEMFDYQIKFRREVNYFYAPRSINYRAIIVDPEENFNLTVLKGKGLTVGTGDGEFLISEQFAKTNPHKIDIGDVISISNGTYSINGYATDALSFVPSQDRLNPLPNPAISTFIYGTTEAVQTLEELTPNKGGAWSEMVETGSIFYWNRGNKKTANQRLDGYYAALGQWEKDLNKNEAYVHQLIDNPSSINPKDWKINRFVYNLTNFDDSNYRFSWTIAPMVVKIFLSVTGITSAIIIIIVLFSLVICIRKTIQFNAKQIGILKAMGSSPSQIAISYIAYSIVIALVAIPLGWIAGNLMQIPFASLFLTYFSIIPDIIFFDWISFVITFFGIGVLAGVIGYLSAYRLTNISVMKILENPVKWHNSTVLNWFLLKPLHNSKFKVRFSITLASAGSRQIWLMSFVLLITSILVTTSLVIPSVAQTTNRLFYRNVRYSNSYDEILPINNSPLSKNAISYWEGHDAIEENDYVANDPNNPLKLDASGNGYGYYRHADSYYATISNGMALPQYLYQANATNDKDKMVNTFLKMSRDTDELLTHMTDIFGNNFYNNIGTGFSIGMIDALYGIILHSVESLDSDSEGNWTDTDKIKYAQDFSAWLTTSVPNIIKAILAANGGADSGAEESPNKTWKDEIMQVLYNNLPTYVRRYVDKNESRLDQYAITYQDEIYIPEEETLITKVDGDILRPKKTDPIKISITGLDKNQRAYNITTKNKNAIYLPTKTLNEIDQALNTRNYNKNITWNGKRLYDANSKTLTLPILPNRQAESTFRLKNNKLLENFNISNSKLQFLTSELDANNEFIPVDLPSGAWLYDDTSYANLAKANPNNFQQLTYEIGPNNHSYLNPYVLDNNKFSFKSEFKLNDNKDTDQLVDNAFLFKDFIVNNEKVEKIYTRPYYQYKDLKLFLPMKYVGDMNKLLYPTGKDGVVDPSEETNNSWYEIVDQNQIPTSVKNAWNVDSDQYIVINPYDLKYFKSTFDEEVQNGQRPAINNIISSPSFWWVQAGRGSAPLFKYAIAPQKYVNKDIKINLEAVGTITSFSDNLVVIDSDLANLLSGMPMDRQYQYNYAVFDNNSQITPGKMVAGDTEQSQFDRYQIKENNFIEQNFGSNLWQPKFTKYQNNLRAEDYAPHKWYTGKLSNVDEPLSYSTTISYAGVGRVGSYALGIGSWNGLGVDRTVQSSTLLTEQRAMISQITGLAVAIGSLLLITIIITSSLLVMLVGDIYIAQYRQFMVLMKALGYSNMAVMGYSLGTVSVIAAIILAGGHAIGWIIIASVVTALDYSGLALPFGFNWWVIPAYILVMVISYFVSLLVSSYGARKDPPTKILAESNQ